MPDTSPVAFGLLNSLAKAGTCEVSRPIIPARSDAGSAARAFIKQDRKSVETAAQNQSLCPPGRDIVRCISLSRVLGCSVVESKPVIFFIADQPRNGVTELLEAREVPAIWKIPALLRLHLLD